MDYDEKLARLTEREKICLRQWLQHKSAKEIAAGLGISHYAVEKRLKMARTKLGATSSLEAARMLSAVEGYGPAVPQSADLPRSASPVQTLFDKPLIIGVAAMGLIGALLLTLAMQAVGTTPEQASLLDRVYDDQLNSELVSLVASAKIGPDGDVYLSHAVADPRYLEPNSGRYWQISGFGRDNFTSRSLWGRELKPSGRNAMAGPIFSDSGQFPNEPLRIVERAVRMPGSNLEWHFIVGRSRQSANPALPND